MHASHEERLPALRRLGLARTSIVLLGLMPMLGVALLHPAPTVTESLASVGVMGMATVAWLYALGALVEFLVLRRVEGLLGAIVFKMVVFTAVDYEVCDPLCVTHRSVLCVLAVVETCFLYTRGWDWPVLAVFLNLVVLVFGLVLLEPIDKDDQRAWIGALELLALALTRLLAAQTPVNTEQSAWAALTHRVCEACRRVAGKPTVSDRVCARVAVAGICPDETA